jgi:hypothetical protein
MTTTSFHTIWLDYSRDRFDTAARSVPVSQDEVEGLRERDRVLVVGDDVPKRLAVIERIDASAADTFQAAVVDLRFYPDHDAALEIVRQRGGSVAP